ncbi:hypothetical protein Ade02nite_20730 [Paractinoplanes deccanensis]|uniref:Uncharacterized protein n=1 Tax=Paractinoplanes deccanensis TaxID=113561 RepID=A0ABQ3Y0E6_9ACTN|nr:hypothetical protein [Actinoplanes deccanensis]GID73432.1 hypothetical protein Ade02nite_20730 [Actinoplanes deccanensis]
MEAFFCACGTIVAAKPPSGIWEWFFGWADVAGGIGAVIAIGFAVRAQRDATKARKSVARERRRQFEVQILREIVDLVDDDFLHEIQFHPNRLRAFKHRFALLSPGTLPYWQKLSGMNWYLEVRAGTEFEQRQIDVNAAHYAHLQARPESPAALDEWDKERERLAASLVSVADDFEAYVKNRLLSELLKAIADRVDAVDD